MCTRAELRAPPLRLPALRALPPLMLMIRPQPAVFMKGMTAREQRSAPTYFVLKSCSKSSSTTVSIGPVAVAEPPGADPLLTRNVQTAQLLCRLGDHAVHLLLAGDIGCEGNDAPVRRGRQLSRSCLQIPLVPRHDRHIDPFASQFPRNGLANSPTAASHDRMLALQSEVHGTLFPWRRDRDDLLLHCSLFSLREPGARGGCQTRGDAWNVTTGLRQSRRPSAIHRAHPIPFP